MAKGTGSFAGKVGWSVGLLKWLDSPDSQVQRYWRAIEYGSTASMTEIIGLWGNEPGSNARPSRLRGGELFPFGESGNQKFAPFMKPRSGGDRANATQAALMYYLGVTGGDITTATNLDAIHVEPGSNRRVNRRTGKSESRGTGPAEQRRALFMLLRRARDGATVPFVRGDVTEPIRAHQFYSKTWDLYDWPQREIDLLNERLASYTKGHSVTTATGRDNLRKAVGMESGYVRKGPQRQSFDFLNYAGNRGGLVDGKQTGIVSITASKYTQDMLRDGRGFPAGQWQAIVQEINARMAKDFQERLVEFINEAGHLRVPTGDLVKAHGAEENRYPQLPYGSE